MKVDVIGSGSAFSLQNNTSAIRVIDEQQNQCLIDCGPTVPRAIWQRNLDVNAIQALYFTHIHPDHCSGLAALLNQMKSFNRSAPLDIFCQAEQKMPLIALTSLATWPEESICFDIRWHTIEDEFYWKTWKFETACTQHEIPNRAVRISVDDYALFYSGDGRPTAATRTLMHNTQLSFQECASFFALEEDASHGDFPDCIKLLEETGTQALGLYHCFDKHLQQIEEAVKQHNGLFLSHDGLVIDLKQQAQAVLPF